ncbi:hypothetical protein MelnitzEXVC044M_181 [Methylophilales phage Melnitz EXVC044M]|nr:hypothetical protein Melnitz1EXVC043M_180 [Methylophilales phage Melnitz-1 EXVC043M]QZI94685.1 hypothetical protein Melnitz2EXVC040M_181 [Methylophilales phage Melnitz-2 EXVC040M]QZI94907.1 hypothetical protein MelnitzEXVC044M_181 [Methylophilales phage Melnitz EXVC044M]
MSLIKINNRSLSNNAVTSDAIATNAITSDAIATDAVTTAKIANDAITHPKILSLGSMLFSWDTSVSSMSGTGWRTMSSTITLPSDSTLATYWANMMSVTFFSYISSGTWYYNWRVYDVTANTVVQPISGPSSNHWYGAGSSLDAEDDGGFRFRGAVHQASQQPARVLDVTGRGGNGITLEMRPSNGNGDVPQTNASQTLYADQIFWYAGAMTGMHNENGY